MTASNRVLLLADDLMLTSRVSQSCDQQQVPFRSVRPEELLPLLDAAANERVLLLVDLEAAGLSPDVLAGAVGHAHVARVIGYGPHVKTGLFDAAREAGLQDLMSRGQFSAQAAGLVADFCRSGSH